MQSKALGFWVLKFTVSMKTFTRIGAAMLLLITVFSACECPPGEGPCYKSESAK